MTKNGTRRIRDAVERYPRGFFLPPSGADRAGVNTPISIGYGQTNSQPTTVYQMLEWLDVRKGMHVLDVGSGSGWTTALLSHLTGEKGDVVAVERIPELVAFGKNNCRRQGIKNITFHKAQKKFGWARLAPYDRILVSASAEEMPEELLDQLASPGSMVIPVGNTIYRIEKNVAGSIMREAHSGYVFVPLIASDI